MISILVSVLSFFLPTQLGHHFTNFDINVIGFSIDYLVPTIYLTDLISILIIIFGFKRIPFSKKYFLSYSLFILFVLANIINSELIIPSIYKWLRIIELIFLGLIITNTKEIDIFINFIKPLSISVFIISLLGIMQFINKGSIGGLFYFLGERTFSFLDPNISPYPYATFSHPNSFAGFLVVFLLFFVSYKNKINHRYFWSVVLVAVTNIILANSLNVYLVSFIIIFYKLRKDSLFMFGLFDTSARFITHRIELINASFKMIRENILTGVGLNNFIPNLVKVSNNYISSWELQPVHNIFLLLFTETGIIGLLFFLLLLFSNGLNVQILAIALTGLSDHYWLTLQQNMLLMTFSIVFYHRKSLVSNNPKK